MPFSFYAVQLFYFNTSTITHNKFLLTKYNVKNVQCNRSYERNTENHDQFLRRMLFGNDSFQVEHPASRNCTPHASQSQFASHNRTGRGRSFK